MSRPFSVIGARLDGPHARDGFDEFGLAVALHAGERQDLARSDVERDPVHRDETAIVAHDQVANLEYVRARCVAPTFRR